MDKKNKVKLLALDLDGTFLNEKKEITEGNRNAIIEAKKAGVQPVISTGRPYVALAVQEFLSMGMEYAITMNGAEIYRLADRKCMYLEGMDYVRALEIISALKKLDIRIDFLIDGCGYGEKSASDRIDELGIPDIMKDYIRNTRILVDDMETFIKEKGVEIPKITLNFYFTEDVRCKDYDEVLEVLEGMEDISFLSGGYHNLEITKKALQRERVCRFWQKCWKLI